MYSTCMRTSGKQSLLGSHFLSVSVPGKESVGGGHEECENPCLMGVSSSSCGNMRACFTCVVDAYNLRTLSIRETGCSTRSFI